MTQPTSLVQARLAALGYDPGPHDGVFGRRTAAAVRAFQRDRGLAADGVVGPLTRGKLFSDEAPAAAGAERPWYEEARRLIGTREVPGPGSSPAIEDWAQTLGIPYRGDDIPWCGLFVAHCIGATLADEPLPAQPLGARNWLRFGRNSPPGLGSVLVFWRESRAGGKGHVGFYAGEDHRGFYVLGGNQSDTVTIKRLPKAQFLGARWPVTAGPAEPDRVELTLEADAFETALG